VATGVAGYDMTPDGKKILAFTGGSAKIQDATAGATAEPVPTAGMTAFIDPREEWKEIFEEAWRIERDFFYDPNMHGVNWKGVHDAYARMLADCNSRGDVGYVVSEMISELNVGHAYYGGGDLPPEPAVSVGMLGADYALENGAYRIKKIYRGAAWDTDAVGPLSEPGVKVGEGDYLLAVNGVPVDMSRDPWAAFQGLADKTVTVTVSAKPTADKDARDVVVRLLGSEGNLRYRAWIEKNRAYVDKVTGGKVGYIYVPNTGTDGQGDLVRQFVGQMNKAALIIDERWNGGGQIPTRFIEMLNRPITNYWARRDGQDWPWPPDAQNGPKCMLINGLAGSGGDAFPWYFRQAGLGKLIGTRTWGGLIGLSGNPSLIDGAVVTAPTFAFYKKNGTWGIEGHGVDPDIEVLDDPSKMQNGADPQLDAAIRLMLDEVKNHPYVAPLRPAYPNRSKMGVEKKDI
jgi:tricorn protease